MNTLTRNENKGKNLRFLTLAVIGILTIAIVAGIWGVFRNTNSMGNSQTSNHNQTEMIKNKPKIKKEVPAALADAGEFSENIYDMANKGDWKTAEAKLSELKTSVTKLNAEKIGSDRLNATLATLEKTVAAKDKTTTLVESNKLTFEAAELTAKYDTKIPIEITKLDYYGREIEIWAGEKDKAKLEQTTLEIRKTWDAVRPKVEEKNGKKEADVFEALVKKTEIAISVLDYAKLATPILDEVDNLEKVFG